MNWLSNLKGIHWTAILLTGLAAIFSVLAQQPVLAPVSAILNALAGLLQASSLGTALAAHKVGAP